MDWFDKNGLLILSDVAWWLGSTASRYHVPAWLQTSISNFDV